MRKQYETIVRFECNNEKREEKNMMKITKVQYYANKSREIITFLSLTLTCLIVSAAGALCGHFDNEQTDGETKSNAKRVKKQAQKLISLKNCASFCEPIVLIYSSEIIINEH